jgi:hypothetical protein
MTDITINPGIDKNSFESMIYDQKNFGKFEKWPELIIKAAELIEECFANTVGSDSFGFDVETIIAKDDLINGRKYFQIPITLYGEKLAFGMTDAVKKDQVDLVCKMLNELIKEYSFSFSYASSAFVAVAK